MEALCGTLSTSTSSDQSWTTAKKWLNECSAESDLTADHYACRSIVYTPARLISVGLDGGSVVHLWAKSEHKDVSSVQYTTLSHCWGGSIPLKAQLRLENLGSMKTQVDMKDLPLTFVEAITATRKLGLKYLWIDSLCIIQNCLEDWLVESGAMGDIYANGYCNLAATASLTSAEGLFRSRNPLVIQSWKVHIEGDGISAAFYPLDDDLWARNVDGTRLNSRGVRKLSSNVVSPIFVYVLIQM